jgi:hypothetical protein
MLCTTCGGLPSDEAWKKGPVKLRYTGRGDLPYVAVCERCGGDVDYQPRRSVESGISKVGRLASPHGPSGSFHP